MGRRQKKLDFKRYNNNVNGLIEESERERTEEEDSAKVERAKEVGRDEEQ